MAGQLKLAPLHGAAMTKQVLIIHSQSGHLSKKVFTQATFLSGTSSFQLL